MRKTFATAALAGALMISAAHAQEAPRYDDLAMNTIAHDGLQRRVGLYVPPSYDVAHPAPLIIALHGRFSSAQAFHAISHLRAVADARGAILLYPETVGGYWNDGGYTALHRRETPADDEAFITASVEALAQEYAIDRARLFLVGYDVGGLMAYRLACQRSLNLAGVAVVSALMWDYAVEGCANAPATPMLILHGRRDEAFPERGGPPGPQITARRLGVSDTLAFWRRIDGCGPASATGRGNSALYASCREGASLAYVGVDGGEHDWFHDGANYRLNRQGVDAAVLIERFFFDRAQFALPNPRASAVRARSYFVYAPPNYNATQPMPAVILLHGRPSNATAMAQITQMNEVALRHGFIAVYPEGINNEWNAFFDLIGRPANAPQDDVAFLETLADDLRLDLNIDPRRVYVAGFSNGGFMTIRLACTASDHFAGFASVGAQLYSVLTSQCRGRPAPILLMHGTGDRSVPYLGVMQADGRGGEPTRVSLSAQDTVAFFIRRNHCSFTGASTAIPAGGQSPETSVIRFAPRDCADSADVMFYLINGGGHNWPGVRGALEENDFGPTNMDINAGEVIWNFFQGHTLPQAPPN